jgi:Fe-S-cluster containining protein
MRHSLKEQANGDCVFYDRTGGGCTVYAARPRQCRSWPFWDSNLKTPQSWAQTCRECPGAGQGNFYSLEQIEAEAARIRI